MVEELEDLLAHYFELGVAEGAQGRSHDTEAGEAQATLDLIRLRIERAIKAARAEERERAAQIADWFAQMYLDRSSGDDLSDVDLSCSADDIAAAIRQAGKDGGAG